MPAKPERRKSALNMQPYAPNPAATDSSAAVEAPKQAVEPAAVTSSGPRRPKTKPKVSFYQDPEDTARARAALLNTLTTEGNRSLSEFIDRAVMAEVERLERKHNNGKPWESVPTGELPVGRRMAG